MVSAFLVRTGPPAADRDLEPAWAAVAADVRRGFEKSAMVTVMMKLLLPIKRGSIPLDQVVQRIREADLKGGS